MQVTGKRIYLIVNNLCNVFLFLFLFNRLESGDSLVLQFTYNRKLYQDRFLWFSLQAERKRKAKSSTHNS